MRRALMAGIVIAALMTSMVPVVSASSVGLAALQDRGADREGNVARAVATPARPASVLDARRRPMPQPVPVVAVPFVCAVHLAEGGDSSAASD